MKSGPIILIEDDKMDQELIREAIKDLNLKNELIILKDGVTALNFLRTAIVQPLIILCDINIPKINGIELYQIINEDEQLKKKSIPFIFLSTANRPEHVKQVYRQSVQGYFIKGYTYQEIRDLLQIIVTYWKNCVHPNSLSI